MPVFIQAAIAEHDELIESQPNKDMGAKFVRYWARILRSEMNYPRVFNEANRLVACNKLDEIWRTMMPTLRKSEIARYKHAVVARSFIPSIEEIKEAAIVRSEAAEMRRLDLDQPVIRRGWFGAVRAPKPSNF